MFKIKIEKFDVPFLIVVTILFILLILSLLK